MKSLPSYWGWFFRGTGPEPGYRTILNWWLFVHLAVGLIFGALVRVGLREAGSTVMLPLVGILVAVSFAFVGSAQAVMRTGEVRALALYVGGGYAQYIYTFQTCILVILVALIAWGCAALNVYDRFLSPETSPLVYFSFKATLFGLASLALRESWQVVMGTHLLLIAHDVMRSNTTKGTKNETDN